MRIKHWVLPVLIGSVALLPWLLLEQTRHRRVPRTGRERSVRPQPPPSPPSERSGPIAHNENGRLHSGELSEDRTPETDRRDDNWESETDLEEWFEETEGFKPPQQQPNYPVNRVRVPAREAPVQAAVRPPFVEKNSRKGTQTPAGNLPRNTPAWFREYDANGDGHIALHEWKARETAVREFHKYDLNRDGIITIDELARTGQFAMGGPAPVVLSGFGTEIGYIYYFELTGNTLGGVWGSGPYTTDSPMATAAVHAGVLRPGETAFVKVTILPGQQQYFGSTANGVTTHDHYVGYHKSFRIEAIR